MSAPLIEFRHVFKRFGQNQVLRDVNLSIYKGEITTIIGKSGVGKSVLLKHVIGLLEPDGGEILFKGRDIAGMNRGEMREIKRSFSYMFQNMALFDSMTCLENIALPLLEKTKLARPAIEAKVREKARQLEIEDILDRYPSQVSGGMKKRVAFARALITEPEIVLFDEPTTGLDPIRKNAIFSMIAHYQKQYNFTAVIVSHDIPDVFFISQRVAMISDGTILFEGSPEEIQHSDLPEVREFVSSLEQVKDELTGLDTKARVELKFRQEICRCEVSRDSFVVVIFRVDDFDQLAAKLGHLAGQTIIKNFARVLKASLRAFDVCSRFSGHEILAILPNTGREEAVRLCQGAGQAAAAAPLLAEGSPPVFFTISALVAEAGPDSDLRRVLQEERSKRFVITRVGPAPNGLPPPPPGRNAPRL